MAPWNHEYFPAAMRHLDAEVRDKAIEIANALLSEGHDEGFAIRVAIAKAKEWAGLDPLAAHREHDLRH
jgi:uncharacterized protein YdaT